MKNRLTRLLKVLEWYPRSGDADVDALAEQLGASPATIRRDLRDLRDAGAFEPDDASAEASAPRAATSVEPSAAPPRGSDAAPTPASVAARPREPAQGALFPSALSQLAATAPANDNTQPLASLRDEELLAMYVGARFLANADDTDAGRGARSVVQRVRGLANPALGRKLDAIDLRFRFDAREAERRLRHLVAQSITERRVLSISYRGERDGEHRARRVEPLLQFYAHDRWSFLAFCREAGDVRQFRHERCRDVKLTDEPFAPRGFSFENFLLQKRRAL